MTQSSPVTTQYPVTGMTCASCERRIERAVGKIDGVAHVRASHRKGTVQITGATTADPEEVALALIDCGYALGQSPKDPWLNRQTAPWRDAVVGLGVVLIVITAFVVLGLDQAASSLSSGHISGGLTGAALLGLTAGFSTCMVTVGGLALSIAARFSAQFPKAPARARWGIQGAFNLGRVGAFALLGALLGSAGSAVAVSTRMIAVLLVLAAIVMALVGIRLTELSPRIAHWSPALPGSWGRKVNDSLSQWTRSSESGQYSASRWWSSTALIGAGTFFLPCAFTQAAQMMAFASGSPVTAAALLAVFALGTTPGLFAVAGAWAGRSGRPTARFARIAGVIVLAFAVVTSTNALSLWRSTGPVSSTPQLAAITDNVTIVDGLQVMRTEQKPNGYYPADAAVHVGTPVRWEITSSGYGCASIMVASQVGVDHELLIPGETRVVEFTPTRPGTWEYTCSMGMTGGTVTVLPTRVG